MASNTKDDRNDKGSAVNEWGLYDPDKAGLNALFNRLDETPTTEPESGVRTRVLNLSGVRKPAPPVPGGRSIL